jgi:signal transduction histidine kinase
MESNEVDGLRNSFRELPDQKKDDLVEALFRGRDRELIFYHVSHLLNKDATLEQNYQHLVDALTDKFADLGNGYKFGFQKVGIYERQPDGSLVLRAGNADLEERIPEDHSFAVFRSHMVEPLQDREYWEWAIPLTVTTEENEQSIGTIYISNHGGQSPIQVHELYKFFHVFGEMAAETIDDIIAHKNEALAKREAQKEKERSETIAQRVIDISSGLGHDMARLLSIAGGPLNQWKRFLDEIEEKYPEAAELVEKSRHFADIGITHFVEAGSLNADLMDIANLAGKTKPDYEDLQLNELIEGSIKWLTSQAENHNAHFSYTRNPELEHVKGDICFMRVVYNLLTNAYTHGEGGEISISTRKEDDGFYLTVTNEGYANLEKMFDRRWTTKKGKGGLGWGMTIIKNIVDLHGGKIEAENIPYNGHSKVSIEVYIPQ